MNDDDLLYMEMQAYGARSQIKSILEQTQELLLQQLRAQEQIIIYLINEIRQLKKELEHGERP